jgi:23S rRNA pseudouridine2605 synthase
MPKSPARTTRIAQTRASTRTSARHGLARVLSKLGLCSRTQGEAFVRAGRVHVNGRIVRDPHAPTSATLDRVSLDGVEASAAEKVYIVLNKPRGYVTTASDDRGRDTVYDLLRDADSMISAAWIAPVGRLDKASEGLLLFSNDTGWAARLIDPATHVDKTYHVQIDALLDEHKLALLVAGTGRAEEFLAAKSARELRRGEKNSWLEIVLDEGRNRQIRRLLAGLDIDVLRLIRVAIGPLELGELGKGRWRALSAAEVAGLSHAAKAPAAGKRRAST